MKVFKILNLSFLCLAVSVSTGKTDDAAITALAENNKSTNETFLAETDAQQAKGKLRTYWQESGTGQDHLYTTGLHYNGVENFDFNGDKPSNSHESLTTGKNVTGSDLSVLSNSLPHALNNQFPTSMEEGNDINSPKLNVPGQDNLLYQKLKGLNQDTSLSNLLSSKFSMPDLGNTLNELLYPKQGNSFKYLSSQKLTRQVQGKPINDMPSQNRNSPHQGTLLNDLFSYNPDASDQIPSLNYLSSSKLNDPQEDNPLNYLMSQKFRTRDQDTNNRLPQNLNDEDQGTSFNNLFSSKLNGPGHGKLLNDILSKKLGGLGQSNDLFAPKLKGMDLLSQKLNSLDQSPSKNDLFSQKLINLDQGSFKDLFSKKFSGSNPKHFWLPSSGFSSSEYIKKHDDQNVYGWDSPQENGIDLSILSPRDNDKLNLLFSTQMSPISGRTPCDNSNALANIVNNLLGILLSEMGESPNNVNVLIDSINTNIKSNPNGIFDTKLYPLLKKIESSTTSGASSVQNRLKRDLKSKVIFKTEIPRISEPDCKEAFLKLMALAYKSYIEASKLPDCKIKNHIIPDNPYNPNKVIIPSLEQEHDNLINSNFDVNATPETITYKTVTDNDQNDVADKSQDDLLDHLVQTLQQADTNKLTPTQKSVSLQLGDSVLPLSSSLDDQVRQKIDDQIEKELSSILGVITPKPEIAFDASINKPKTTIQYIDKSNESWFKPINNSPELSSSVFPNASLNNDTEKTESFSKYLQPSSQNYVENPVIQSETVSLSNLQTPKVNRDENIENVFSITIKDALNNLETKAESSSESNKSTESQSLDLTNLSKSENFNPNPNSDTDKVQVKNDRSVGLRENSENPDNENRYYFPGMFYTGNQPSDFSAILSNPKFRFLNPQAKNLVLKNLLAQYGKNKNVDDDGKLALWLRNPNNSKLPQIIQKNYINIYVTPSKQLQSPDYNSQIENLLKTILGYVEWLANKPNRDDENSELLNNIHSMVYELVTNPELRQNIVVLLRVYANWASKLETDGTMDKNIEKLIQYVKNNTLKHNTKNLVQDSNSIIDTIIQHFQNNIRKILPNSSDQQIVLNQLDHLRKAAENGIDLTKPENLDVLLQYLNEFIKKIQNSDYNSERNIVPSIPEPDFAILRDIAYLLKDMGLSPEEIVLVTSKVRQYIIDAASRGIDLKIPENYKNLAVFVKTIIEPILSKPVHPTLSIFDTNLLKTGPIHSALDTIPSSFGPNNSEFDTNSSKSGSNNYIVETDLLNAYPTSSISNPISFNPGSTHSVLKTISSNNPTDSILETIPSDPDLTNIKTLSTSYDVTGSSSEVGIPTENSPVGLQLISPSIREILINHIDSILQKQDAKAEVLRLLENYVTNAANNGIDVNKLENFNNLLLYLNGLILQFIHESPFAYKEQSVNPAIINYFTHVIFDLVPDPEQRRIVTSEVSSLLKKYLENGVNLSIERNLNKFIWDVVNIAKNANRSLHGSLHSPQYVTEPDTVEILFRFKHKIAIRGLNESALSPNSYVKYTVPFQVFTKNLRDIMLRTPSLRSDPNRLQKELELKSNIIEVSPELQGLPKSHLVRILTHDGSFVDAKVPDDTRRSNFRSAAGSQVEFKEKIHDLDRIINKIRTDDREIGTTTGSSKAITEAEKTPMDQSTFIENDTLKDFNPLEFNAGNPFYLNLNNNTATVNKDLTRRIKLDK